MAIDLDAMDLDTRRRQAFADTVRREHPMGAARIVRRERYAWPGGYALALVLTDGALLCPDCVTKEWRLVSAAHRSRDNAGGWRPLGLEICEAPDQDVICDHCGDLIAEGSDSPE
jgi:hypothetical protein